MHDPRSVSRRGFLRRVALLGSTLAGGALSQACLLPATPAPTPSSSCRPAETRAGGDPARPVSRLSIAPIAAVQGAPAGNPAISHVVVLVIDGMMPEYLGLGAFPHLESLVRAGTSFDRAWVGQLVNNTPVSHATLSSGLLPRRTGVVYFYWRDPRNNRLLQFMSPPMIEGGAFAAMMREQGVPSLGRVLKQHRPGAKVASLGSTKDFAAVAMALDSADHVGYAVRLPSAQTGSNEDPRAVDPRGDVLPEKRGKGADGQVRRATPTPPVRSLAPGGPAPAPLPDDLLCDPRLALTTRELGDNDLFAGNLAVALFEKVRPELLMLNLPDADQVGHLTGGYTISPAEITQVMARADAQVGRLIEAYRAAGIFEKTLWVVTSDHGMTPNSVNLPPSFVQAALDQAGYQLLGGDTVHYWLKRPDEAPRAAVAIDRQAAAGFIGTYFKVHQGNGKFVYEPTRTAVTKLDGRQRAAVEWLLESFVGPQSPDLVLLLGENVHLHDAPPNTIGAHSEATWLLQRIPLVFSGPGVRAGRTSAYPARLVDVAPTILALLGLPAEGMDGLVLQDVLAGSSPAARDEQLAAPETRRMLRYQDTLASLPSAR